MTFEISPWSCLWVGWHRRGPSSASHLLLPLPRKSFRAAQDCDWGRNKSFCLFYLAGVHSGSFNGYLIHIQAAHCVKPSMASRRNGSTPLSPAALAQFHDIRASCSGMHFAIFVRLPSGRERNPPTFDSHFHTDPTTQNPNWGSDCVWVSLREQKGKGEYPKWTNLGQAITPIGDM